MPPPLPSRRLRAALHGTPGGDYRDAMLQLGLTPASGSDRRLSNGGRRTRSSAGLRRDSDSGRLSDRCVAAMRAHERWPLGCPPRALARAWR